MIIHTKQKAKIHIHEPKQASIKGSNIYTVDRNPTKKKGTEGSYRKCTVHKASKDGKLAIFLPPLEDGDTVTTTYLCVNVTLKNWRQYAVCTYGCGNQ